MSGNKVKMGKLEQLKELKSYFKNHTKIREVRAHSAKVHSVGWSCSGRRLASASFDKTLCTYFLDKDRVMKEYTYHGHTASVDQLVWHKTSSDLVSTASGDKTVRIWDVRASECAAIITTKGENINIAWSPEGKTIAVGNKDDLITFIDTRTNKIRNEEQFSFEVNEIDWNNSGDLFFLTNGEGAIHILEYPKLELQHTLKAHTATCICIEFDPTGRYFATGSADSLVSLWDANELACLRVLQELNWPVRSISFNHDGTLIASGSEDLIIDISQCETGAKVAEVVCDSTTFTVAWHPKQNLLAYACDDKENSDRRRELGNLKVFGFEN